jgi:hypothetical protein
MRWIGYKPLPTEGNVSALTLATDKDKSNSEGISSEVGQRPKIVTQERPKREPSANQRYTGDNWTT